jgi:integrase
MQLLPAANFPGSPSAVNNALRTLHRMLSKAVDWKGITRAPKIHLAKEVGRSQLMSPETEAKLLSVADQPLRDVIMIMQDGGMRPAEVFRMSVEHIDWQRRTIFVPFGKTRDSRRFVPMSERVMKADGASRRSLRGLGIPVQAFTIQPHRDG